jgi:transcriptional regulator of acetoin/glycerol metabolism
MLQMNVDDCIDAIDRPHAAAAAARGLAQQTAALERAAHDVAVAEAALGAARHAQQDTLVRCVHHHRWPVSLAAAATNVSRETAHKWLRSNPLRNERRRG